MSTELTPTQAIIKIIKKRGYEAPDIPDDVAQVIDQSAALFLEHPLLWETFSELLNSTLDGELGVVEHQVH